MSRARAWTLAVLFLAAVSTLLPAAPAVAQSPGRVAVLRVRGPRGGRARSLLVSSLEEAGYEIVSDRDIDDARRRLGIGDDPSEEEWVRLAADLRVRAFVSGRVTRARRSWRLTVSVRNGFDGAELGDESWGGRTTSAMDGVGRNGAERLSSYLSTSRAPSGAGGGGGGEDGEAPWWAGGPTGRGGDDEDPSEEDEEEEEEEREPSDVERHDSFRISASGGSLWRSFWATANVYAGQRDPTLPDDDASTIDERRGYEGSNAELGLEAEFYPGALGDQPFPYLGLLVSFRNSAGLTSSACRNVVDPCERLSIATNQTDVQAGARGRYRFGPSRRDFELFGELLYGYSSFTLDQATLQLVDRNAIIPPMEYQYVSLGAGFRYGIVPDAFTIGLRADYRIGIGVGTAAKNVWGLDTGAPQGFLLGLDLTHEANWLVEGVFVTFRLEYFQMLTTFRGQVGCADPSDCTIDPRPQADDGLWELWPSDPANPDDVTGGIRDTVADHYVRWGFYVGYAFR